MHFRVLSNILGFNPLDVSSTFCLHLLPNVTKKSPDIANCPGGKNSTQCRITDVDVKFNTIITDLDGINDNTWDEAGDLLPISLSCAFVTDIIVNLPLLTTIL